MDTLKRYAELQDKLVDIRNEITTIEEEIRGVVDKSGPVAGYGYIAKFKPGRKSTNHELAATENSAPRDLVDKFSTTRVTVQWAKITKEMGIDLEPYTSAGDSTFVIEAM